MRKYSLLSTTSLFVHLPFFSFIGLLCCIFYFNRFWSSPRREDGRALEQLKLDSRIFNPFIFPKNEFAHIIFLEFNAVKLIKNSDNNWVASPGNGRAIHQNQIGPYLEYLAQLKVKRTLPYTKENIKNFSLAIPILSLRWKKKASKKSEEKTVEIHFGIYNPMDRTVYATIEGNKKEIFQLDTGANFMLADWDQQIFL